MKKGFTLIELLAVIVIIAIIGLIGLFSVTKILSKARMNALTETAFGTKKAVSFYLVENQLSDNINEFDLSPGSGNEHLIEISNDPWGKPFDSIKAILIKNAQQKYDINIYLTSASGCFVLQHDSDSIEKDDTCNMDSQIISSYSPVADWRVVSLGDHYGNFFNPVSNSYATIDRASTKTIYDKTTAKIFDIPANQLAIRPLSNSKDGSIGHEALLEEARTNYVLNSSFTTDTNADGITDNFSKSVPAQAGDTYSISNESVHGTKSQKIEKTSPTTTIIYQNMNAVLLPKANETYTFSVWVKGENVSGAKTGADFGVYVDAIKVGGGYHNPPVVAAPVGTFGWTRLAVTYTFTSDIQNLVMYPIFRNKTGTVWFDAMQIEKGTGATSFIPTTTTVVARLGDKVNIPTTNWRGDLGSVIATYTVPSLTTATYQLGWNAQDATNKLTLYNQTLKQNWGLKSNGALTVPTTQSVTSGSLIVGAISWTTGTTVKQYVNGGTPTNSTNSMVSTMASMPATATVGYLNNGYQPNAPMHRIVIYNKLLTASQITEISDKIILGTNQ